MVSSRESVAMIRGFVGLLDQYIAESTYKDAMTAMIAAVAMAADRDGGRPGVVAASESMRVCPVDALAEMLARPDEAPDLW